MMKNFSRFILYRRTLGYNLSVEKANNNKHGLWFHNLTSRAVSTARKDLATDGSYSVRTSADYSIFKGKAALVLEPLLPKFKEITSGLFRVDKRGSVMLKFMPAIGQRKYDWEKRQVFALSATELGSLMSLGPGDSCEFFHDPSKNTSLEGQVRKTLSVAPMSDDGGYFFSLSVAQSNLKTNERLSVPVSKAEFAVMRTSFAYILPHIMGWDRLTSPPPTNIEVNKPKQSELQLNPNLEWDR
ncbi:single-stranded DNA-binding protein WHY2, mitochondrial isoform X1 [Magnolia sinica]|uniref:single-stranded DNA-binding protein WHY2, mitochondrial isoform X1 n=2 Tax=Magnolia sinica TaxID=86752 RepID=UPI0026593F07|nr:single-stranded DNA-binding protein WHY2, mitochondrial isoform X1 [Magnolia sinica]